MNLTHTVQSIAHDAASAASDLGSQAADLGSKAAERGADAASSVASAATNLAHAIGRKVPGVKRKRRIRSWRFLVVIAVAVGGAMVALKGRRKSGSDSAGHGFSPPATKETSTTSYDAAGKSSSANESSKADAQKSASGNGKVPNSTIDAPPSGSAAESVSPASTKKD